MVPNKRIALISALLSTATAVLLLIASFLGLTETSNFSLATKDFQTPESHVRRSPA